MNDTSYDVLVIGGGPGGSAVATYLARAGKRVLVLEREKFPRFHIGESLLPYNRQIFAEMGVLGALQSAGFPVKYGAQFHIGNGTKSLKLVFQNGKFTREPVALQVERARFDHILLQHARTVGAEVREGCGVTRFETHPDGVAVEYRDETGQNCKARGLFLIDASGRVNFTGNQESLKVVHPRLKKVAVFGHFEGVALDEGKPGGDTVIVRLEDKWFWLIPVSATKTSVGCVMDQAEFTRAGKPPQEVFNELWRGSTAMRARLENARLLNAIQTTGDFSYYNRRLAGPRVLRVGDAAGFMDPIFSAGVYLAMYSGKLAAGVVVDALGSGQAYGSGFDRYETEVFRAMRYYWEMVEAFYTTSFMELFLEPRPRLKLPDAITAILAGEVAGGWKLDWRKRAFFGLVKAQKRLSLVPRISFVEGGELVTPQTTRL